MRTMQPIEDRPEIRSFLRNTAEWSITILMWVLWIYFFLPLVSLILWAAGFFHFYRTLFRADVLGQLFTLLGTLALLVVILFIVLRGWGLYNYYLFGRLNRRRENADVTVGDIGRHFSMTAEQVYALRECREIIWTRLYDDIIKKEQIDEAHHRR